MVRVPTPEEEDRRRVSRELKALTAERVRHVNRVKGLLFSQGIIIRDVRHRFFTQNYPLPPLGVSQVETFSSEVDFSLSMDNGATFTPATGTANVTVQVTHSSNVGATQVIGALNSAASNFGTVTLGANGLTVGSTNALNSVFAGTISGSGGSLTKANSGKFTLSGTSTGLFNTFA